jgi:hypothetical protein
MKDEAPCDIHIDREGVWRYQGAEMHRKDIVQYLAGFLQKTERGYCLEIPGVDYADIDVEDTPLVVVAVDREEGEEGEEERMTILLSDGREEVLDLTTLTMSPENILYCVIREGKFPCRFLRKSYYQLTRDLKYDEGRDEYFLCMNGARYVIRRD